MRTCILFCTLLMSALVRAEGPENLRGELLYSTHCIQCHTEQMHWRSQRLARDWNTLQAQVDRWQQEARLNWTQEDVNAVTRYLNDTIYNFPRSQGLFGAREFQGR